MLLLFFQGKHIIPTLISLEKLELFGVLNILLLSFNSFPLFKISEKCETYIAKLIHIYKVSIKKNVFKTRSINVRIITSFLPKLVAGWFDPRYYR